MDGFHFDALTRTLATAPSRRRVLTGLVAGTLALVGAWSEEAVAKKCNKVKNKKKRKRCRAKARGRACTPTCAPTNSCGPNGCGGSCGSCRAGLTCCAGTCVDLATDPVNCGACDRPCLSGGCLHGACTCTEESQCRTPCNCCDCFGHDSGGQAFACAENIGAMTCNEHADCALGSVCLGGPPGLCTLPCPG